VNARRPFEPVGSASRAELVYPVLERTPIGSVASYQALADALQLHPLRDRPAVAVATRDAGRRLLVEQQRAIEVQRNLGYRIVQADEHLRLAKARNSRARTQLRRGLSVLQNTDFNELTPEMRAGIEAMTLIMSRQEQINREQDRRNKQVQAAIMGVAQKTDLTAGQVEDVLARIAELEARMLPPKPEG
jgi:hypothetical protein